MVKPHTSLLGVVVDVQKIVVIYRCCWKWVTRSRNIESDTDYQKNKGRVQEGFVEKEKVAPYN